MNTGQIVKSKSTERFTVITNEIIKSKNLTLGEKGLLAFLLSLPADWVLYKKNLYSALPDPPHAIDRYFKGLQEKGYIISVKVVNENFQFIGWNHIVYDQPSIIDTEKAEEKPTSRILEVGLNEKPTLSFPEVGDTCPILKTNNTILKTKESTKAKNALFDKNILLKSNLFREPVIPQIEEVEFCFLQNGGTIEMAKSFYNRNQSTGWFYKGSPIINFRTIVSSFVDNWKKNESGKNGFEKNTELAEAGQKIIDDQTKDQLKKINEYFKK